VVERYRELCRKRLQFCSTENELVSDDAFSTVILQDTFQKSNELKVIKTDFESCTMESFVIYAHHQILLGGSNKGE
jgi:hypothetical protein